MVSPRTRRKMMYFLRLQYPMHVVFNKDHVFASHPDLPGCELIAETLEALHTSMYQKRIAWLREVIAAGYTPPLPNSTPHHDAAPEWLGMAAS